MSQNRIERVTKAMQDAGLDALFVSNPKNVQYLAGFHANMPGEVQPMRDPEGMLVIEGGRVHLICDGRYIAGARQMSNVTAHLLESPSSPATFAAAIRKVLGDEKGKTIGFESNALLYVDATGLLAEMSGATWTPAENLMAELRVIKTPEEVENIRKAQAITGRCFDHVANSIRLGESERDVAVRIETFLRRESEGNSFAPIVAFGQTGCHPHYSPDPARKLERGQMVLLDFGGIYHGYCGDMTRMLVMGKADERQREVYEMVLAAQQSCLDAIKPGVACHALDAKCRDYFAERDCADHFMHGTGHGVGLAVHEGPSIKKNFDVPVQPGMVFSVEPGLYYEDWGGVRIEDLVAVTDDGYDNLTTTSKTLLELDY